MSSAVNSCIFAMALVRFAASSSFQAVNREIVGLTVGEVGLSVGCGVGAGDGTTVGRELGAGDGDDEGLMKPSSLHVDIDGTAVGLRVLANGSLFSGPRQRVDPTSFFALACPSLTIA